MPGLIQLRRHIKSIQTTKKVTYAMRLISMSLYSKLENLNDALAYHQESINNLFEDLHHQIKWYNPILFPKDILDSTPLIVFVASSKGLCGGFNSGLIRFFKRHFFREEHQTPTFITVGAKATTFVQGEDLGKILCHYNDFTSNNFLIISEEISQILSATQPPFSSVTFYINAFRSFLVQQPQKTILVPFTKKTLPTSLPHEKNTHEKKLNIETLIWEQEPHDILNFLAMKYLKTSITHLLFQSLLAEQASRFLAMDKATANAEDFLESLSLQYNKLRQSLITKELSELSVGFVNQ